MSTAITDAAIARINELNAESRKHPSPFSGYGRAAFEEAQAVFNATAPILSADPTNMRRLCDALTGNIDTSKPRLATCSTATNHYNQRRAAIVARRP